ncbi:hypothetical protein F5Y08DRAFT_345193 [Xylaria arbuscula]|nr:hypothetical protein F5Y08DRAFT_345193 [Xylaria arbuscula]
MKITISSMAAAIIVVTTTAVSGSPLKPTFSNSSISPDVFPPNGTEIERVVAAGATCDKEGCQACIHGCGGVNHYTCFYFQCFKKACKGCNLSG